MNSREEKVLNDATVCFPVKGNEVLLGLKTKKIGQGCWNGYGGGIEAGETPIETAVRELEEEAGIRALPEHLEKIAIVDFHNTKSDGGVFICKVHFYLVKQWVGEVKETDEMITPTWFDIQRLPFEQMMPSDKEWLPVALSGKKIIAKAKLGAFQEESLGGVVIEYVDFFPDE